MENQHKVEQEELKPLKFCILGGNKLSLNSQEENMAQH